MLDGTSFVRWHGPLLDAIEPDSLKRQQQQQLGQFSPDKTRPCITSCENEIIKSFPGSIVGVASSRASCQRARKPFQSHWDRRRLERHATLASDES